MKYVGEIRITEEEAIDYQKVLDLGNELSETLYIREGVHEYFEFRYEDGVEAVVILDIDKNKAQLGAYLYDNIGNLVDTLETRYKLEGEYVFEHKGNKYILNIDQI